MANKFAVATVVAALSAIGGAAHAAPVPGSFVVADIAPPRRDTPPMPKPAPVKPVPDKPGDATPPKPTDTALQLPSAATRDFAPLRWIVVGAGFVAMLVVGAWWRRTRAL